MQEQSGIKAGEGGFDVQVGNKTHLVGGLIASEGGAENNRLETGTLEFEDIGNKANYKVSHMAVSIGTGVVAPPIVYNKSGHADSVTKSAVEAGELVIRDGEKQQQDIASLSRNTENANNPLGQIFDKDKELKRLEAVELVREIAQKSMQIKENQERLEKQREIERAGGIDPKDIRELAGKLKDDKKTKDLTDEERYDLAHGQLLGQAIDERLKESSENKMGGSTHKAVTAAASIIEGLLTGNIAGGLAGAAAPHLASEIKKATTTRNSKGELVQDKETALVLHAILGGVLGQVSGGNALAGATGAVVGETSAEAITKILYPGKTAEDLSESDKRRISSLASIAGGLAGAVAGSGDTESIKSGLETAKNAVENNFFSPETGYVAPGIKELAGRTEYAMKELQELCGSGCTDEQYKQVMQDNGLIPRDAPIPPEVAKQLFFLIPIVGDYASIREAIANDDYESVLLTVTQLKKGIIALSLGKIAIGMGKSADSLPDVIKDALSREKQSTSIGNTPNKPLDKDYFESQYGKGKIEQGGGNTLQNRENVHGNIADIQKGKNDGFAGHADREKELIDSKPIDGNYLESQYGKGSVAQGGGNSLQTKENVYANVAESQKGKNDGFAEHAAKDNAPTVKDTTDKSLIYHENWGGHTIQRHVGKSDAQLLARFQTDPKIAASSTFKDLYTADKAIGNGLSINKDKITNWLKNSDDSRLVIQHTESFEVGRVIRRGTTKSYGSNKMTIVIDKDPSMPNGFRVQTAYPK